MSYLPDELLQIVNEYAFDKQQFDKILKEIKNLRYQQYHYKCSEYRGTLRPLTQILKIKKIRGWCEDCGVILYSRNFHFKYCRCEKHYENEDYLTTNEKLRKEGLC